MGKKVVIADDAKSVLFTAESLLVSRGYEVIAVDDGAKAMIAIKKELPEFAILDIEMPEKTGFVVCKEIKESDETKKIIVIIVSGNVDEIEKSFEYGADDCFIKPIYWDEVIERMENLSKERSQQ